MSRLAKVKHYPTWTLSFENYWFEIKDDIVRQQHLLNFFYKCGVLNPEEDQILNASSLAKIQQDNVIALPEELGAKNIQLLKGFSKLRQCFLAETLYVNGVRKEYITKKCTSHSSSEEGEKERWKSLQSLGGMCVDFACRYTPVSKYNQARIKRKVQSRTSSMKKGGIIGSIGSNLMTPFSGKKRKRNNPDPMPTIREMNHGIHDEEYVDGLTRGGLLAQLSSKLKTPFSSVAKRRRVDEQKFSCGDQNPRESERKRDVSDPSLLKTPISLSATRRRTDDQEIGYVNPNKSKDDAEDLISRSSLFEHSPLDLPGQHPHSFACQTPLAKSNLMLSRFHNSSSPPEVATQIAENPLNANFPDASSDEDSAASTQHIDRLSPGYDEPPMQAEITHTESSQEEQSAEIAITKYGLLWKSTPTTEAMERNNKSQSEYNAKKTLDFLHSISKGDLPKAKAAVEKLEKKLVRIGIMDEPKDEFETKMIANIRGYYNSKMMKSRGKRDTETRLCMAAATTAIISPENGFHDVSSIGSVGNYPFFCTLPKCPVLQKSKKLDTFKIVLPFGILYCHAETLKGYRKAESGLPLRSIHREMGINRITLAKCQVHRNDLHCGINSLKMMSEQKKNSNNWDKEISDAVRKFGHDPEYVRPDNYSKQKYCCVNADGERCIHDGQRHNWMINGDDETQYEFFQDSAHFQKLFETLKALHPTKDITKELVKKKASFRKFRAFRPKCIRPETRASCVDPIEAPAYDNARCLQLHFKGIRCTQQKLRSKYHQESEHQFYDPDDSEEDDSSDDEDGDDSTNREQEGGISLYEQLQQCQCEACRNGRGWLQIFDEIKDARPHLGLLKRCLCPRIGYPELTLKDSNIYTMSEWKCYMQTCPNCGVDRRLPFDCPVIAYSNQKIKIWVWNKASGDNERTHKTAMPISKVFRDLRVFLKKFAKHTCPLQFWNQNRKVGVEWLIRIKFKAICLSDFASQMDLIPVRKVNCHVNKHASLGVFVILFQQVIVIDGEEFTFIACHEWFIFGSCEEKGKQNDWIFHNKAQDYIQAFYTEINIWEWFTDNCPGQYKCRQNLLQLAKKTTDSTNIEEITHNFAKQHGFKNKCDTIGHWVKSGIKKKEHEHDMHASNAVLCCQLALNYLEEKRTKLEKLLGDFEKGTLCDEDKPKLKKMLRGKSPYESTQRHAAYIEDDKETYDKLKAKLPNVHIIYSDRARMKKEEDMSPVENTTDYYSFSHKKADDNPDLASFADIPPGDNGEHTCRYCFKVYQNGGKLFRDHEKFCGKLIETGKAHKLQCKYFKCFCNKCHEGNDGECRFREISGTEEPTYVASIKDIGAVKESLRIEEVELEQRIVVEESRNALSKLIRPYPSVSNTKTLNGKQWKAIEKLLNLRATRLDGKNSNTLRVEDIRAALREKGEWDTIIPMVQEKIDQMQ